MTKQKPSSFNHSGPEIPLRDAAGKARAIPNLCKSCGEPLQQIPWNTRGDMLVCQNWHCSQVNNPQGWVNKSHLSMTEVLDKSKHKLVKM